MDKFLFTDGTSGVKEVHSHQELQKLIDATAQPDKIRIWIFNSHEWISYAAFRQKNNTRAPLQKREAPVIADDILSGNLLNGHHNSQNGATTPSRESRKGKWLKKNLFLLLLLGSGFLVFNFTRITWEKGETLYTSAARPANVPVRDIDSLIWTIEELRGQKLDRSTRTNLRLRNTWPERILVQLQAAHETNNNNGSRFSGIELMLDNTTGFTIDNVVVRVTAWSNQERSISDTFQFDNLGYIGPVKRLLDTRYRGDSLSISVESIRAKSFNFCYSSDAANEEDHYDPWFCKDEE